MRIATVEIKNFKAISSTKIELSDFNVIVGSNGSGKSSVLQAMHWMFQSGRNSEVWLNTKATGGATLSEKSATYLPSLEYRLAGNYYEYGNKTGAPQLSMTIEAVTDEGDNIKTELWMRAARNQGMLIHVPSDDLFVKKLKDQNREFSAYIPGLAGISLSEEKRSQAIVHRLAAAGDANTILRNMLLLLTNKQIKELNGLVLLKHYISKIFGDFDICLEFIDEKHSNITACFWTESMNEKKWKPLELAGVGLLQAIQIFAYIIYFEPVLLLIDEPDAHLHPSAQERLVAVLAKAAQFTDTQVILTTHSPSIVRALPSNAKVIWMKDGEVQDKGNIEGRHLMGWGLLDRKILMLTEDENSEMVRSILSQWPHLERAVAVWPLRGSGKLPEARVIKDFINLTAGSLKVIVHRDRDFLMPNELKVLSETYENEGHIFWVTRYSDMEAYWANTTVISAHFNIPKSEAESLLMDAVAQAAEGDKALEKRRKKRNDAMNKLNKDGKLRQHSDMEVEQEATKEGCQYGILGKDLVRAIRSVAQRKKLNDVHTFAASIPPSSEVNIATDLYELLGAALEVEARE